MHSRIKINLYPILPSWCLPDTNDKNFILRTDTWFCPSFLFWSTIDYEIYKFVYGNKVNIWIHFIIWSQLDWILKIKQLNTEFSITFLLKTPVFCQIFWWYFLLIVSKQFLRKTLPLFMNQKYCYISKTMCPKHTKMFPWNLESAERTTLSCLGKYCFRNQFLEL